MVSAAGAVPAGVSASSALSVVWMVLLLFLAGGGAGAGAERLRSSAGIVAKVLATVAIVHDPFVAIPCSLPVAKHAITYLLSVATQDLVYNINNVALECCRCSLPDASCTNTFPSRCHRARAPKLQPCGMA